MKKFFGYIRTLKMYLRTPKGRHDFKDFFRAALIIFLTAIFAAMIFAGVNK